MSTTALTAVNNVIKRLRGTQVTSVTFAADEYAQLILQFVNEAKREVEDSWDWLVLRRSLTVTTSNGTPTYTVTGAGERFRFYDRRKLIWNTTNRTQIQLAPQGWLEEQKRIAAINNQYPSWYRFIGQSGSDPIIEFYATPDAVYSLSLPLVIPDADLSANTDTFKVPLLPVELGAWARAIGERGEDGGVPMSVEWQLYNSALGDYIAIDSGHQPDELIWETV